MWWYALQFTTFAAVLFSNAAWHWTPNGFAASFAAFIAALLVTEIVNRTIDLWKWISGASAEPEPPQ